MESFTDDMNAYIDKELQYDHMDCDSYPGVKSLAAAEGNTTATSKGQEFDNKEFDNIEYVSYPGMESFR